MKFFKNKKGFTLVELVVVIAILGILAGIAIPRFMDATASARGAKIVADMRTLESASTMYYVKKGTYTGITVATLVSEGLLASTPTPPTGDAMITESKSTTYKARFNIPATTYTVAPIASSVTNAPPVGASVALGSLTLSTLLGS